MSKFSVLLWRKLFESGDTKRLATQIQDLNDLEIRRDIAYLPDGDRGHLLDIYRSREVSPDAPLVINVHGGGLFDYVFDAAALMRDPEKPNYFDDRYHQGDYLHPNEAGGKYLAEKYDLRLLTGEN